MRSLEENAEYPTVVCCGMKMDVSLSVLLAMACALQFLRQLWAQVNGHSKKHNES